MVEERSRAGYKRRIEVAWRTAAYTRMGSNLPSLTDELAEIDRVYTHDHVIAADAAIGGLTAAKHAQLKMQLRGGIQAWNAHLGKAN